MSELDDPYREFDNPSVAVRRKGSSFISSDPPRAGNHFRDPQPLGPLALLPKILTLSS